MKKRLLPFTICFLLLSSIYAQVWEPQADEILPPNYSIMNLSIINDQVVWAVAIDFNQWVPSIPANHLPKVLRTTNGGADWSVEDFPQASGRMTYGIVGLDENTALLSTNDFSNTTELFKTTNGGDTWSMVDDGPAAGGRVMFFNAQEGVSVSPLDEAIARTDNGGNNWTTLEPGTDYPPFLSNDGHLNAPTNWDIFGDTLWIGTSLGKLYRSTDKGQNWTIVYDTNNTSEKFISTAFMDGKNGLAVVGVFNNPPFKLLRTSDGGENWEEISNDFNLSEIFAIPCTNSFIGASFYDSLTVWSTKVGESWEILDDNLSITGPTFSAAGTGWTAIGEESGLNPAIYKWMGGPLNSRIYVNHAATGNNDGTSWTDAYTDLQVALSAAKAGDEIWVAEGTYLPDTAGGETSATFRIDKNLKLYGGFAGTECNLSERDVVLHPTIFSGDLNGDDVSGDFFTAKSDNVESVMEIAGNVSSSTIIDGFTIKGGYANGNGIGTPEYGGGIFTRGAPTIRHCIFEQNFAKYLGGGLYIFGNDAAGIMIEHCRFLDNLQRRPGGGGEGGGLYIQEVTIEGVSIRHCDFTGNEGDDGGGLSSRSAKLYVNSCTFMENHSIIRGGGISLRTLLTNSTMSVRHSHFEGNTSAFGGGAYLRAEGNDTAIESYKNSFTNNRSIDQNIPGIGYQGGGLRIRADENAENNHILVGQCTFENNSSDGDGGGIQFIDLGVQTTAQIDSCLFESNTADRGSALSVDLLGGGVTWDLKNSTIANNQTIGDYAAAKIWTFSDSIAPTGTVVVDNCAFEGNTSVFIGGMDIGSGTNSGPFDFTISNTDFLSNQADYGGGFDIWGDEGSKPTFHIENCLVEGNTADIRGGGFWILTSSGDFRATMDGCRILNNSSPQGAGITAFVFELNSLAFPENAEISITNSLISGNTGSVAIEVDSFPGFQLTNCTVADNPLGGIQLSDSSGLTLQNNILYNNGTTEFEALTNDVTVTSKGGNLIGDSSLDTSVLPSDLQNADPLFNGMGDPCTYYQLTEDSPAIDMGIVPNDPAEFDLCGENRIRGAGIDIGALESPFSTDVQDVAAGEILLSPNPTTDYLNIQFTQPIPQPNESSLFDNQGKLIRSITLTIGEQVDVRDLPPGMYLLKVVTGRRVYTGRFVKH